MAWLSGYGSGAGYRKKLTIDHTVPTATLSNFSKLFKIAGDSELIAHCDSAGASLRVTSSNGTTPLAFGIVSKDIASGNLIIRVNVPTIDNSTDKDLYLYYKSSGSNGEDRANAIDSYTKGYWPNETDPTGSANDVENWAGINHGTSHNFTGSAVTGQVGNAYDYDGSNDYVNIGTSDNFKASGDFTLSAIVNPDSVSAYQILFGRSDDVTGQDYVFGYGYTSGQLIYVNVPGGVVIIESSNVMTTGSFQKVDLSRIGSTTTLYRNGTSVGSGADVAVGTSGVILDIGRRHYTGFEQYLDGKIDEATAVFGAGRTADWLAYEWVDASNNSSTFTKGSEETESSGTTVTPPVKSLSLSTFVPGVVAGGNKTIVPPTESLTITRYSPTVPSGGEQITTFYSEGNSTSDSGFVNNSINGSTFEDLHDAADGTDADYFAVVASIRSSPDTENLWYEICRGFAIINTYDMPDGAVISSAKLGIYINSAQSDFGGNLDLVSSSPANINSLLTADFDQVNDTLLADSPAISDLPTGAYYEFDLNGTGIGSISSIDVTRLALRVSWDTSNTEPTWVDFYQKDEVECESTGGDHPPYLEVVYSVADNVEVVPPTKSLSLSTFAPTVVNPKSTVPPTKALSLATFAPVASAGGNKTATPTTTALATTKFSPQLKLSVIPPTKSLATAKFAPAIVNPNSATPPTKSLTLSALAPAITAGGNKTVVPPVASLTLNSFAPVAAAGGNQTATPGALPLSTTKYAPAIINPKSAVPPTIALVLTKFSPSLSAGSNQTIVPGVISLVTAKFAPQIRLSVSPPVKSLTTTKFSPTVVNPKSAVPPTTALVLANLAPVIEFSGYQTVTPGVIALTTTRFAPQLKLVVSPPVKSLTTNGFAPTVFSPRVCTPLTKSLILSAFAPAVSAGNSKTVVPGVASLTTTKFAPVISTTINKYVVPGVKNLILTKLAPSIGDQAVVIGLASLAITRYSPIVGGTIAVIVPKKSIVITGRAPQLKLKVSPPKLSLILTRLLPVLGIRADVTTGVLNLVITRYSPFGYVPRAYTPGVKNLSITKYSPKLKLVILPLVKALVTHRFSPIIRKDTRPLPSKISLILTEYRPSVGASANKIAVPGVKVLILTKFAPTIRNPRLYVPPKLSLVLTKFVPTTGSTANKTATPSKLSLVLTKYKPQLRLLVSPATKNLTTTKFAPVVTNPIRLVPSKLSLVLTRFAPTTTAQVSRYIVPPLKVLILTKFAPQLKLLVAPPKLSLVLTKYIPVATGIGYRYVVPGVKALLLIKFAPQLNKLVSPARLSLILTKFVPDITAHAYKYVVPGVKPLVLTEYTPTIRTPRTCIPSKLSISLVKFAPTAGQTTNKTFTPSKLTLALTKYKPQLKLLVSPPTKSLTTTKFSPVAKTPRAYIPPKATLNLTKFIPIVGLGSNLIITPPTKSLVITKFAPSAPFATGYIDVKAYMSVTSIHLQAVEEREEV